jgi:hypothetical protein
MSTIIRTQIEIAGILALNPFNSGRMQIRFLYFRIVLIPRDVLNSLCFYARLKFKQLL